MTLYNSSVTTVRETNKIIIMVRTIIICCNYTNVWCNDYVWYCNSLLFIFYFFIHFLFAGTNTENKCFVLVDHHAIFVVIIHMHMYVQ